MKRVIFLAGAATVMSVSATAAELPARAMAPAPVFAQQTFSWTGFYAGVNAGWTRQENRAANRGFSGWDALNIFAPGFDGRLTASFPNGFGNTSRDGFIGGVQAGYNQQFGMFVAGVEADISFLGNRKSSVATSGTAGSEAANRNVGIVTTSKMDWLGTLRLRGGIAVDRLLVYGTGGLAFGAPRHRLDQVSLAVNPVEVLQRSGSKDETRVGWTIGGGGEYAFTDNLTLKAEYLYYDLGSTAVTAVPVSASAVAARPNTVIRGRFDNKGHIARVGMNYKF